MAEDSLTLSLELSRQGLLSPNLDRAEQLKQISSLTVQDVQNKAKSIFLDCLEISSNRNELLSHSYNSFYGINYQQALFEAIDNTTPEYIQLLARHYLSQPYITVISGDKEVINANKEYLSVLGEIIE